MAASARVHAELRRAGRLAISISSEPASSSSLTGTIKPLSLVLEAGCKAGPSSAAVRKCSPLSSTMTSGRLLSFREWHLPPIAVFRSMDLLDRYVVATRDSIRDASLFMITVQRALPPITGFRSNDLLDRYGRVVFLDYRAETFRPELAC